MANIYGYIRVSTKEQNEARQLMAMEGIVPSQQLFIDHQSGKDFDRPQYKRLLKKLRQGDLVVIKSIDRLGRSYEEVLQQWQQITKQLGADIRVLDMPLLDTTLSKDLLGTFISDLVLQLLSFVAQNEREMIHQRQSEGIAAAKSRGVKFGRPTKPTPPDFERVAALHARGNISCAEACRQLNMPRSTYLRKIKSAD